MLNNFIKALFFNQRTYQVRTGLTLLLAISLTACSVAPENTGTGNEALSTESNKLYLKAVSEMKSGNTKSAQILLNKVIRQQPNFSNAHVNLAIIYINMKMLKKAGTSLQQALKIDPNNIIALNQQAYLFRLNGEFTKAKDNYEKAIDLDSNYATAHLNLGILYDLYFYDFENAIEQYKKYNELSKDNDKKVSKWIVDLERRNKNAQSKN